MSIRNNPWVIPPQKSRRYIRDYIAKYSNLVFVGDGAEEHKELIKNKFGNSVSFCRNNTQKAVNMCYMFSDCKAMTSLDISNFNTSLVTDMSYMFENCINLTSLDVSKFKCDNVIYMNSMFQYCNEITSLDLSNCHTPNLVNTNTVNFVIVRHSKFLLLDELQPGKW